MPKIPSMKVLDLAKAMAPRADILQTGIRSGEKLHEVLVSEDEARNTVEHERMYIVKPPATLWERALYYDGGPLVEGLWYSSDSNTQWLDIDGIRKLIEPFERLYGGESWMDRVRPSARARI